MSETVKVTVIAETPPISIVLTEPSVIKVTLYPVTVAHPSILEAAGRAEGSAENASSSAQAAALAAQEAIAAVASIGATVDAAVEAAKPEILAASIINALIFG